MNANIYLICDAAGSDNLEVVTADEFHAASCWSSGFAVYTADVASPEDAEEAWLESDAFTVYGFASERGFRIRKWSPNEETLLAGVKFPVYGGRLY